VKKEKKCKCEIPGVRKKNGNWRKSSGGKKIKVFAMEIKVKVEEKKKLLGVMLIEKFNHMDSWKVKVKLLFEIK
jgi:hypothetical protein